jgi:hypothetical protein
VKRAKGESAVSSEGCHFKGGYRAFTPEIDIYVDYAHLKLRQFQHTTTTHFNLPHAYYMKHILKTEREPSGRIH